MAGEAKMLTGWARRSFFRAQHVAAQLQPKCTPRSITRFRGTITAVTRLHGHFLYAGAARGFASSQNESNRKQPLNVFWTLPSPEDIATATVTELHQCLSWVYRKLAKPLEQHGAVAIYASRTIQFTAMVRSFGCRLESLDPETALGVLESLVRLLWRCPQRSHQKIQRVAEMSFERFLQGSFQVKTADLPRFYLMLVRARVRKASFIAYVETHLGAIARQLDVTGTLTFVKVLDALSMTEEEYVLPLRENLERCSTNLSATEAVKVLSTLSETFFEDEKMLHYAVEQVTTKVATLPSHIMILAYRLLTVLDQDTSLFLKMMAPLIIHRLDQKKLSLNAVFDLMQMLCVDHMAQRSLALELLKDFAAEKHAYTRVRGQQPHCISSAKALYVAFACLRFAPTDERTFERYAKRAASTSPETIQEAALLLDVSRRSHVPLRNFALTRIESLVHPRITSYNASSQRLRGILEQIQDYAYLAPNIKVQLFQTYIPYLELTKQVAVLIERNGEESFNKLMRFILTNAGNSCLIMKESKLDATHDTIRPLLYVKTLLRKKLKPMPKLL